MAQRASMIALLIASLFISHIHAMDPGPAPERKAQETDEHEVTVTLKLVQVYVTDKKSIPVMDLDKDDFELYDQGHLQKITDFEKYVLTVPVLETSGPEDEKKDETPAEAPGMSRKFFLFFDFAFNTARGILDSKEAALHFIDMYLQPTDEVGLFSFSMTEGLILHETLTTDHQKVREVVEGIGIRKVLGRAHNLERAYWRQLMELDELHKQGGDPFEMAIEEQEKEILGTSRIEFQFQISFFIQTVKSMAKALRYLPGSPGLCLKESL